MGLDNCFDAFYVDEDEFDYCELIAREFAEEKKNNKAFRNALDSLEEVSCGFYKLPGSEAPSSVEELILLVHPYNPNTYTSNIASPNYTQNLNKIIKDYDGPILLAIEPENLASTVDWLKNTASTKPRIIYLTRNGVPVPAELTAEELLEGILELFKPSSIRLGGAELYYHHLKQDDTWHGCVGETYEWLKVKDPWYTRSVFEGDVHLDEELCWATADCCSFCEERANYEERKASMKPRPEELERLLCKEGS